MKEGMAASKNALDGGWAMLYDLTQLLKNAVQNAFAQWFPINDC